MPVVARALEDVGRNLRGVPGDRGGRIDVLATLLVEGLVEKQIELDVSPRFPQVFDCIEDLELDADVLF